MYPAKPSVAAPPSAPVTGVPVGGPPPVAAGNAITSQQWSSGLFDCFDDCGLCCLTLTCWCPCITFGRVAEIVDRGETSCGMSGAMYTLLALVAYLTGLGCQWIYSCTYRSKMRAQFGLPETPCCDCCVHFCCEPCALCQQYRELKVRGFDPDLGWDLNAQRGAGAGGTGDGALMAAASRWQLCLQGKGSLARLPSAPAPILF